jgi:hypothetical protein
MIIDSGSGTNITSMDLVDKLNLHITKHHVPYNCNRLNDCGEVKVFKQVLISFSLESIMMKYYVM